MKYQPPYGTTGNGLPPPGSPGYLNGNPAIGLAGSIFPAAMAEEPQTEIVNAIIAAGLVPTDNDLTQLTAAIKLLGRIPYVIDQGAQNHLVINPTPAITAYGAPLSPLLFAINVSYANTGATDINVSGLGAVPLTRTTGAALSANDLTVGGIIIVGYNGAAFELLSVPGSLEYPPPASLDHYGVDISSSANSIIASCDSIGSSWPTGIYVAIKVANANTGATTVTLNGLGPLPLTRGSGLALIAGDVAAGYIALMIFDGTEAQLINFLQGAGGGSGGNDITGPDRPYWLTVNSATVTAPPPSPSLGDTYLVPPGATGSWSGLSGRLAQWNGSGWVYRSYPPAALISASDTSQFYENIGGGIWEIVQIWTLGRAFYYCQL